MIPLWSTIPAIIAVLCGGWLLAFCRSGRKFHTFIGFTLLFDGLFIILEALVTGSFEVFYAPMYLLYTAMMLSVPFFYYFAARFLLKETGAGWRDLWMPEVIVVFCAVAAAVTASIPVRDLDTFQGIINGRGRYGGGVATGTSVMLALDNTAYIFFLLEQIFVQIFCFISLAEYKKSLQNWYSSNSGKSLGAITIVLVLMAARFLLYVGMNFVPSLAASASYHTVQGSLFSLFFIIIALFSAKVKFTAEELEQMSRRQMEQPNVKEDRTPAAHDVIKSRMDQMIQDRFYLDSGIDLMTMSTKIGINYKYITDYLKYEYGETFMAFVNRLRIEYSETLLRGKTIALPDIAEQSGFISDSTFYRNFIKTRGMTPSKYRKMHQ